MEARDTYGRAVTDWSRVTVGQMWQMIGDHNPEPGHSQAGAWDRTRELVDHHLTRIQSYREDLVRTWNPQTSPAAAMYFARIDALIESMTAVRDGSSATVTIRYGRMAVLPPWPLRK